MIYMILIYDKNWNLVSQHFGNFYDKQQAELKAKADAYGLGCTRFEVVQLGN